MKHIIGKLNSKYKIIAGLGLLLLLLLFFVFLATMKKEGETTKVDNIQVTKTVVEEGAIEKKSVEEIKHELQNQVDQSMINMSFNATPSMDADGYYNLMIESTNRNINNYIVEIKKTTGELVWKSPMIQPNQNIKKAKLNMELQKGETKCKVIYHGYNPKTNDYLGFATWQIAMYS